MNFHDRTGFQQAVNQDQRWSFTDIIGPRFKAQSPDCDRAPGQVTAEVIEQFSKQDLLLLVIRFIDSSQNTRLDAMFGSQRRESPDVFRKTRTPVSDARKQKRKSNPSIVTDAFANFVNVRSDPFADICHLIDKTDLCGQHTVRRILDHLCAFDANRDERLFRTQKRLV